VGIHKKLQLKKKVLPETYYCTDSKKMRRIEIKVIPNSNRNEILDAEPLTLRVKDPPIKGKANKTVVVLLSRYFNAPVRIISGSRSRRKIVEIEETDEGMGTG